MPISDWSSDVGSSDLPAGALVEPLIGSDPTLETLKVAEALQPASAPRRLHEVWFDRAGKRALLAVQTRAAGFDHTGQQLAVDAIHAVYAQVRGDGAGDIVLSGTGAFSVEIGGRHQAEGKWDENGRGHIGKASTNAHTVSRLRNAKKK